MINQQDAPASAITIRDSSVSRPPDFALDPATLGFGQVFCPNMFITEYSDGHWHDPRIEPLRPLQLHPGAIGIHYGSRSSRG
jgi:hypothetical protein